ncbi:MAG TPA: Calx-beta domain-containing protein, partial [Thermoanaerobaculia bacterium]|nr:Calx-beta domain-containing protein [Thermoanaerobaculia bacterium]
FEIGGNLGVASTVRLGVTLRAASAAPFGEVVTNTVVVRDDGRFGADANPADNAAAASLRMWDSFTPIVEARPPVNLSRDPGVVANVSSTLSVSFLATRGIDGNLGTSWFTECGDAVNRGGAPFFEVVLPRPATVRELRIFGNRQFANGRDFFSGVFQLFADDGEVLYDSGDVALPAPTRDLTLALPQVSGVRRARFTATADEGCQPGLAELEVIGFFGDGDGDAVVEGSELRLTASFVDSDPTETHGADVDWGDGVVEPGVVSESGSSGTVGGSHVYPDDSAHRVEVCVTDEAGHTGCDGFDVRVVNAPPNVNDNDDIDLRLFQAEGTSGGFNWVVADDGRSVRQTINNGPTFFYGDFQAFGTRIEGEIEVITNADDDFIGFALGFEPGDSANPDADYLLVQWKQGNQTVNLGDCAGSVFGARGLTVSRVRGVPIDAEFWATTNHACNGPENGLHLLARGNRFGTVGWRSFVKYKFTFDYTPTRLRVFVDDVLEADLEGDFPGGRLTFFNHSLANVRYSAFTLAALLGVEGTPVELFGSFTDPGILDTHVASVEWGDGTTAAGAVEFADGSGTVAASHTYLDDAVVTAVVCVTDDDGGTGCGGFPVRILNVDPSVDAGPDLAGFVGLPVELAPAAFTDPGVLDTHTATVDWGDGTVAEGSVTGAGGSGTVSSSHVYTAPGTYEVTVCVTDDDGGEGCDSLTVEVTDRPPELSIGDVTVEEGAAGEVTEALFTVELTIPGALPISVSYATSDGSAVEGLDYLAVSGILSFAPGETSKAIAVPVLGDDLLEPDEETFLVTLSEAVNAEILDGVGVGTILDDELCPGPNLLSNPGAEARPVEGEIPGWTEVEGSDWQWWRGPEPIAFEGVASFLAGEPAETDLAELAQEVDLSAYAARIAAGGQRFVFEGYVRTSEEAPPDVGRIVVEYRDAAGLVLDAFDSGEVSSPEEWLGVSDERAAPPATASVRVRLLATRFAGEEADAFFDALSLRSLRAPALSIGDVAVFEGDSGTTDAVLPVTLSCLYYQEVTAAFATADGTALAGEDYLATSGAVTFPSGATEEAVTVAVLGDLVDEPHETFLVELSGATPAGEAVLADPVGVGTILNDDWCPRTRGFWKNHVPAWPVDFLVLGGVEYDEAGVLALLGAGGPDVSTRLASHLAATKLNLARGARDRETVLPTVEAADAFLELFPPGSDPRGADREEANRLKDALDRFNNGRCAED